MLQQLGPVGVVGNGQQRRIADGRGVQRTPFGIHAVRQLVHALGKPLPDAFRYPRPGPALALLKPMDPGKCRAELPAVVGRMHSPGDQRIADAFDDGTQPASDVRERVGGPLASGGGQDFQRHAGIVDGERGVRRGTQVGAV
ncbi:hypothetical protein D9M72_503580 [compost metagenome]